MTKTDPRVVRAPKGVASWFDELVDEADWAEQTALRSEADPPRYVDDPQAAHHCRVLLFELNQAEHWAATGKRQRAEQRRSADRATRAAERAARAQGVRKIVDDTGDDGRCAVARP